MGKIKVGCCGSFDGLIHPGHIHFLNEAKKHGDELYVFVVADFVIQRNKKRSPIFHLDLRVKNIGNLNVASKIIPGETSDEKDLEIYLNQNVDIFCFGIDQETPFDYLLKNNLEKKGYSLDNDSSL